MYVYIYIFTILPLEAALYFPRPKLLCVITGRVWYTMSKSYGSELKV